MTGEIRIVPLTPGRADEVGELVRLVFGAGPDSGAAVAAERSVLPDERVLTACDTARPGMPVVGTTGSYAKELTLPGGVAVPVAAVTNVGVLPTHRRRGIFRQLMVDQHDALAAEGVSMCVLHASDARIYGRVGYGMASRHARVRIDAREAHGCNATVERDFRLLRSADAGSTLPSLYDAARHTRPGALTRSATWWSMLLGPTDTWKGGGHHEVVVAEPTADDPGGYALYRMRQLGEHIGITVREVVAATSATRAALWRFILDLDLVTIVDAEIAVDDPLPWLVADPRAVTTNDVRDALFARVLDTAAVFGTRRYRTPVDIVLEVVDPFRPDGAAAGRFHLAGGPDGARCARTDGEPDVVLGVDALGSLSLGAVDLPVLAAAGRATELRHGAVAAHASAFGWTDAPFCATRF